MVAVIGARGGVGATTLAVNLGWHLANRQTRRVGTRRSRSAERRLRAGVNIKPTPGLREALVNPARIDSTLLERVMTPVGDRLFVLSSEEPLRDDIQFTADAVETLVSALREQFHYVILDVPRIPRRLISGRWISPISALSSRPDLALGPRHDTAAFGARGGRRQPSHIVRRQPPRRRRTSRVTLKEMRNVLDLRPSGVIPFQPSLFMSAASNARLAATKRGKFADALAALVLELAGDRASGAVGGGLRNEIASFGQRIVQQSGRELVLVPGRPALLQPILPAAASSRSRSEPL